MKRTLQCLAAAMLFSLPSHADSLRIKGADFLDLNENYRDGMVQGILLSMLDFGGTSTQNGNVIRAAYTCMVAHKRTIPQYSIEFARYLRSHPEVADLPMPGAFMVFAVDCPENK